MCHDKLQASLWARSARRGSSQRPSDPFIGLRMGRPCLPDVHWSGDKSQSFAPQAFMENQSLSSQVLFFFGSAHENLHLIPSGSILNRNPFRVYCYQPLCIINILLFYKTST